MRRLFPLLVLSASAAFPQEGGRDPGDRTPPVLFVRWKSSAQSPLV